MFTTRPGTASPIQRTFVGVDFFSVFQAVFLRKNDPGVSNIVKFSDGIGELKVEKTEPGQKLLTTISTGTGVKEAIDEFISFNQNKGIGEAELQEGEWEMLWSSQEETDSWLENAANGLMGKQAKNHSCYCVQQILMENGQIKFVADILLGLTFSITGTFVKSGTTTYDITIDDAAIIGSPFGYAVELASKFKLELLYSDDKIRITRDLMKLFLRICEQMVQDRSKMV